MHIPDFIPRYPFILSILTFKMSQLKCCCETERALFWISGKGKYLREIQIYELSPPISTSLINTHKTKKLKSKTINLCLAYLICCSSFYAPVKKKFCRCGQTVHPVSHATFPIVNWEKVKGICMQQHISL